MLHSKKLIPLIRVTFEMNDIFQRFLLVEQQYEGKYTDHLLCYFVDFLLTN